MGRLFILPLLALLLLGPGLARADTPPRPETIVAPGSGAVRALVIGIDNYHSVNHLRGAVADARDIDASLRKMGAKDVTTLIDDQADRASVLHQLDGLVARTNPGDLIILTLAGHGSKEDERVKGSSPDGADEVFLLVGFDPKTGPAASEKILNHEFHHYIKALESRGAQVLFVADTCYGGGLAREIDPGAPELSYRQVPRYRIAEDDFKPVSTAAEAFLTELDFKRTAFLAAVDNQTKAPEVVIGGKYRGALSYAVARAIEGAADEKGDGKVTTAELFSYVRKLVYQVSDERQSVVTAEPPDRDPEHEIVFELSPGTAPVAGAPPSVETAAGEPNPGKPVRIASEAGRDSDFAGVAALQKPFQIVPPDANPAPDVTWDSVSDEAFSDNGDKIASEVTKADLPGVIDRTAAIRDIKELVAKAPQNVRLLPNAALHRRGDIIQIEIAEASGRSLVLVDVTGNGTVQMLYPMPKNPPRLSTDAYRVPFVVRDPFGADEVVAITSDQSLHSLTEALQQLDGRRSAGHLVDVLTRYAPPDRRIGLVGLFTAP